MSTKKFETEKKKETPVKNKQYEETIDCVNCSITYSKGDAGKHKTWCGSTKDASTSSFLHSIPENAMHGFIYKDILYSPFVNDHQNSEELRSLPRSRLRESVLLLNPKSMRTLNLKIGDHVVLSSCGNEKNVNSNVAIVWPSSKVRSCLAGIPKTSSLLQKTASSGNGCCRVTKVNNVKRASRVRLFANSKTEKTFIHSDDFIRVAHSWLNGTCLEYPEDVVEIPYFGQVCAMKAISTIDSNDDGSTNQPNISDHSLAEQFSVLDIDESSDRSVGFDENSFHTSTITRDNVSTPTSTGHKSFIRLPDGNCSQNFVLIDDSTELAVEATSSSDAYQPSLRFDDLGGMVRTKSILYDHVAACLRSSVGQGKCLAVKTILLYGTPGCGKTCLAEAVAAEASAKFLRFDASITELNEDTDIDKLSGAESPLRVAEKHAPCVVLLDDIDYLTDKTKKSGAILNSFLDRVDKSPAAICVIGTSSAVERMNATLRKRFQFEIEVPVPTAADRKLILQTILGTCGHLEEKEVDSLVDRTHGFTPSDLLTLCKEAAVSAQKRSNCDSAARIALNDLQLALTSVRPSAMREIFVEIPKVRWTDVGGNDEVKLKLQQAVEWPLRYPERFLHLGIKPPAGILMYGPPGCSKTMIAKALATESGLNFLSVKGPELFSKWVGESEKAVRDLFRKARQVAPAVIFFDEIDAIGSERTGSGSSSNVNERVLAQMLTELDGIQPLTNVTVVAATNRPDVIDRALLRPGRFDVSVYVRLPDKRTREEILKLEFANKRVSADVDVSLLVEKTERYSGAELVALCNEAGLLALSEDRMADCISKKHFLQALNTVRPRITDESLKLFEHFETSVAA